MLTNIERETILIFDEGEDELTISTFNKPLISYFREKGIEPTEVRQHDEHFYKLDKHDIVIHVKYKKSLTEEKRKEYAERLKAIRNKSTNNS